MFSDLNKKIAQLRTWAWAWDWARAPEDALFSFQFWYILLTIRCYKVTNIHIQKLLGLKNQREMRTMQLQCLSLTDILELLENLIVMFFYLKMQKTAFAPKLAVSKVLAINTRLGVSGKIGHSESKDKCEECETVCKSHQTCSNHIGGINWWRACP